MEIDQGILLVDYTKCKNESDQINVLSEYRDIVLNAPSDQDIHILSDFTGQHASEEFIKMAIVVLDELYPRISKFIVVGLTDFLKNILYTINSYVNTDMGIFETRSEGLLYLQQSIGTGMTWLPRRV